MDRATRKKLLDSMKSELTEAIDTEKVVRALCDGGGISEEIRDLILRQKAQRIKVAKLVDVLKTLKPEKYQVFHEVLVEQGHEKIARELMPDSSPSNTKRKPRTKEAKRNSTPGASGSYEGVFQSCHDCFINDISADPDKLVDQLSSNKSIILPNDIKKKVRLESDANAKAEILFGAILPQINEYGKFFDFVQILRNPFQHLSDELWEQLKNIVVPPSNISARANRKKSSARSQTSLPSSPGAQYRSQSAVNGGSNDITTSLSALQSDLTETQSDSLKQSLQLEKCIQATADANNAMRKLKIQLKQAAEERDAAVSQAALAGRNEGEARQKLEAGLADADSKLRKMEDHNRKMEAQMRSRLAKMEQKETQMAFKEAETKRREEEQKQRYHLQRRQDDSLEQKSMEISQRGDRQDRRSAEHTVRQDRMRERENNIAMGESQLASREEDIMRKESILKKKEVELHRREIETTRLEEQIKMMQVSQSKAAGQLKQREVTVARAEEDVKIISDNLQQREEALREKERRINLKVLELKEAEEDLQRQHDHLEKKELKIQDVEQEQREWESVLQAESQELDNMESAFERKKEELSRKEEEINIKMKELDDFQNVLVRRLQAQERTECALRKIEDEQLRRDRDFLSRESGHFQVGFPYKKKLEEIEDRMDELKKRNGEPEKGDEAPSSIVEQQRRDQGRNKKNGEPEKGDARRFRQKQRQMAEKSRHQAAEDEGADEEEDRRAEVDSVPPSEGAVDPDAEPDMHRYEVAIKGARQAKRGSKASFEIKVAGLQTVAAFKNILETEEGIPADWQGLTINGKTPADNQTLPSATEEMQKIELKLMAPALKERDTLKLKVKSSSGPTHSIDFSIEDTVAVAKTRIFKYTAIPPHQQQLSYKDVLLEDHAPLQLYSIRKNASLDLRLRFTVMVEISSSERHPVMADEMNTIANIKANIFEKTNLPLDNLKITYKGKPLEDHRTLAHYRIEEGAVLNITFALTIIIHATNTSITLDIETGSTMQQLKELLTRKRIANGDRMYVACGDQVLEEDQDVMEIVRSGKEIGVHVGNVLVMSTTGEPQSPQEDTEQQQQQMETGRDKEQALDLSVSGSQSLFQVVR